MDLKKNPQSEIRNPQLGHDILLQIYERLYAVYGPQWWWPGESQFEIIIGAILTQNTNWTNVERAINNLKAEGKLTPEELFKIEIRELAGLIRPSGYFNIKAKRLKEFINFLFARYQGSLNKMYEQPMKNLRTELLSVKGIGPETADSILLYGGDMPVFVVDAYTKRIFTRLRLLPEKVSYEETQEFFMNHLPQDVNLYNEYHALIVRWGKEACRPKPRCELCPLSPNQILLPQYSGVNKYKKNGRSG
ncbi:MAG: endonuclease III domain-containing protein [bacterium]|nr:endonuclease III domain-containing protein [bacterium]